MGVAWNKDTADDAFGFTGPPSRDDAVARDVDAAPFDA